MYWTQFMHEDMLYTLVATERGLRFFGNDFKSEASFLQWADNKGWMVERADKHFQQVIEQITQYLHGHRQKFDIALDLQGTDFQRSVWQELQTIPYGEVVTYSDVATSIGRASSVRAVANAIGANPLLFIVPCHRVIGKNGALTGFRGGLVLKQRLLVLEGSLNT